ncbi:hypothetical protein GWI33_013327 [Rhynchophorus ferrugineus]|uniref:Chitin-binding type-2 domain-containing protein n=1 Tax=Rhynchophorus ferrugineus TaxID=354439 RepID=A0A834IH81_RHYFE|nr:hypothetical protein GWI33_013327 [Rhynchophorus ferrugineus]
MFSPWCFALLVLVGIGLGESTCVYNSDPDYFVCEDAGSFQNQNDLTCSSYFACYNTTSGYSKVTKTCASGTYFNPSISACDWYYSCPCGDVVEESMIVEAACLEDTGATFECSSDLGTGCFSDPSDPYCQKFVYCYVSRSGKAYSPVKRTCPTGTYFNSSSTDCSCSVDYATSCPCQ